MENKKHTIFIVEDNELVANTLKAYISTNPAYIPVVFNTGEEMLNNLHQNPSLVILDYHLNGKIKTASNGHIIYEEISKKNSDLPVIMLSSLEDRKELVNMLKAGVKDFVVKDGDYWQDLSNSIREIVGLIEANEKIETLSSDIKVYRRRFIIIATILVVISVTLVIVSILR